MRSFAP
ncbi:hypothetical protein EE612_027885 [Oryza sativa]|nr:hypothetical protein EE612_027885 [Oryza sativa]